MIGQTISHYRITAKLGAGRSLICRVGGLKTMMRRISSGESPAVWKLLSILAVLVAVVPPAGASDTALDDLGLYVESALAAWNVPGVAIAVVKDDQVVLSQGFGVRNLDTNDPVDANTLFGIASNTKSFTASAIGLLVQEEQLSWDEPVLKYLPDFQLYDPIATRKITVRDLLCHRSGLGRWTGDLTLWGSVYDRDEVIRRIRYQEPTGEFRASYGYSNLMFLVAGQIIPVVTGISWDEFVRSRFFEPLRMARTNTSIATLADDENVATPYARIDKRLEAVPYMDLSNSAPAAGINSCVNDMAQWLRLQLAYGWYDGQQLVDSAVIDEMRKSHNLRQISAESKKFNPSRHFVSIGLGWWLSDYQGRLVIDHGGALDGLYSSVTFLPEENLGVVVLTNADNHSLDIALTYHIIDAYLGVDFQDWSQRHLLHSKEYEQEENEEKREREAARATGTRPSHALADYAGQYESVVLGAGVIEEADGRLVLKLSAHPDITGTLEHWQYDTFLCKWSDKIWDESLIYFDLNDDGAVHSFRMKVRPDWIDTYEYTFVRE